MNHSFSFKKVDDYALPITPELANQQPQQPQVLQAPQKNIQEYEEMKRILSIAHILQVQKKRLMTNIDEINNKIIQIQKQSQIQGFEEETAKQKPLIQDNNSSSRIKRSRRKADDIKREWQCKQNYCGRKYGAHASLLQHIKLKHPEAYQKYC